MIVSPGRSVTPRAMWALVALAFAAVLVASFVALRTRYADECLFIPWYSGTMHTWARNQFIFQTFFGSLFAIAFLAAGAALMLVFRVVADLRAIGIAVAASAVAYAVIAAAIWYQNPIPREPDEDLTRLYFSAFWPIGLLQRNDNYSSVLCGQ